MDSSRRPSGRSKRTEGSKDGLSVSEALAVSPGEEKAVWFPKLRVDMSKGGTDRTGHECLSSGHTGSSGGSIDSRFCLQFLDM